MNDLLKRKPSRIADYDHPTSVAYFISVCVNDRKPFFWNVGDHRAGDGEHFGADVEDEVLCWYQIGTHYSMFYYSPIITLDRDCGIF